MQIRKVQVGNDQEKAHSESLVSSLFSFSLIFMIHFLR